MIAVGFAIVGAAGLSGGAGAQRGEGCAAESTQHSGSAASHAYFEKLARRPDCWKAYSLRDNAQLARFSNSKRKPQRVTYNPAADTDPRRQDAAKVLLPANQVSLGNTVRLPIGTEDNTTTLVTWDAWFGSEFDVGNTGIGGYKTFQFASPADRIWFEVRTRLRLDEAKQKVRRAGAPREKPAKGAASTQTAASAEPPAASGKPGSEAPKNKPSSSSSGTADQSAAKRADQNAGKRLELGFVDARGYPARGTVLGPNVQRGSPLTPQVGQFTVHAETWIRYWVLIEQRANDWDLVSLWVADEHHDPVLLIDRLQFNVKKSVEQFWLEYNTSAHVPQNLGERVAYARNVVMLRNVPDVQSLLQRPVR